MRKIIALIMLMVSILVFAGCDVNLKESLSNLNKDSNSKTTTASTKKNSATSSKKVSNKKTSNKKTSSSKKSENDTSKQTDNDSIVDVQNENAHMHKYGEWEIVIDATCETDGSKERYCSCGEKEEETIKKIEHTYDDGICFYCGDIDGEIKNEKIAKENERHQETIDYIQSSYESQIYAAQVQIDMFNDLITYPYSESTLNSLYSQVNQKERQLALLQMGNGSKVEIQRLQSEIASIRTQIAQMEESKIFSQEVKNYESQKKSLQQSMNQEIANENALHKQNLADIKSRYGD